MSNSCYPWTVACQALLSVGFSRQEYWRRLPFPSPGDLPDPGTVVLEKTLESVLDCKEIKPANAKQNQPWIFIERTDAKAEALILWPLDVTSDSLEKTLMLVKLMAGGERGHRGWDGWMASLTQWKSGVLQFIGLQRVRHELVTEQQ